jgi:dipeptidase E
MGLPGRDAKRELRNRHEEQSVNLHLFCLPGAYPVQDIFAASKPYLVTRTDPVVLYLPAAGAILNAEYVDVTRTAFENLAEVAILDLTQPAPLIDLESAVERATILYIPGGNSYLLLDRLHRSGAFGLIQARVKAGMPLVGFSAGMVICGPNILTAVGKNDCERTEFTGLGFSKYNFCAHYPAGDGVERAQRDSQIRGYHNTHANPVLALEDDGCIEIDNKGTQVARGHCWLFEPDSEKVLLERGYVA